MKIRGVVFLLLCLFQLSTFGQKVNNFDSLKNVLHSILESQEIPGAFLAIASKDSIFIAEGIGFADVQDKINVSRSTLFRMGSVTKTFTALGVMKLVSMGKFSLDDEIKLLLPEVKFTNTWEIEHPVRVRHLLEHTAGFDEMHWLDRYVSSEDSIVIPLNAINHTKSLISRWPPGSIYSYSNPGYTVAGYLIEKFSGMEWNAYIEKEILSPLGMKSSSLGVPNPDYSISKGYYMGEAITLRQIHHGPAGSLNSNAQDMAAFLVFLLNRGRINSSDSASLLSQNLFQQLETPSTTLAAKHGISKGYALGLSNDIFINPYNLMGHPGGIAGFTSFVGYDKQIGLAYALVINSNADTYRLREAIENELFDHGQKGDSSINKPHVINQEIMRPFLGHYELVNPRVHFYGILSIFKPTKVYMTNSCLYTKAFLVGENRELFSCSDSSLIFRYKEEREASTVFTKDFYNNKVMSSSHGSFYKKISYLKVMVYRLALFTVLTFLFYIAFKLLGNRTLTQIELWTSVCYLLAIVGLTIAFYFFIFSNRDVKGSFNFTSITIYTGTVIYFLMSLCFVTVTLVNLFRSWKNFSLKMICMKIYYLLVVVSLSSLTLLLNNYDLIGLKTWSY